MELDNTIINYLRHNVDPAILFASICLWALIFPDYTGVHFNGEFKSLSPIERKLVRIGAGFMLLCLVLVKFFLE
jgi:hypothetical protein